MNSHVATTPVEVRVIDVGARQTAAGIESQVENEPALKLLEK